MVFLSLGLGGIGLGAITMLTPYRIPLMLVTVVLLGFAHYLVHKRSRKGKARVNRAIVWVSTLAALAMMIYTLLNKPL